MILVECNGDTMLLKYLGYRDIRHNDGSGNIGNFLQKSKDTTALADADPGKADHNYFKSMKQVSSEYSFITFFDHSRNNKLIRIDPDLEGWIWKLIEDTNSKELLRKLNFPEKKERLHDFLINKKTSAKLVGLLREIEKTETAKRLDALRNSLRILCE